jgi:hypothetical protein
MVFSCFVWMQQLHVDVSIVPKHFSGGFPSLVCWPVGIRLGFLLACVPCIWEKCCVLYVVVVKFNVFK